jgi:hypothetical protein
MRRADCFNGELGGASESFDIAASAKVSDGDELARRTTPWARGTMVRSR